VPPPVAQPGVVPPPAAAPGVPPMPVTGAAGAAAAAAPMEGMTPVNPAMPYINPAMAAPAAGAAVPGEEDDAFWDAPAMNMAEAEQLQQVAPKAFDPKTAYADQTWGGDNKIYSANSMIGPPAPDPALEEALDEVTNEALTLINDQEEFSPYWHLELRNLVGTRVVGIAKETNWPPYKVTSAKLMYVGAKALIEVGAR